MNKNKNQAIIVIISLALSIIPIVSPLAVYAEETMQGQDTQEMTYTGDAKKASSITNSDGEKELEIPEEKNLSSMPQNVDNSVQSGERSIFDEIKAGFDSYVFSNETTKQDVEDYFKQILDENNVKYDAVRIDDFNKIDAKEYEDGEISFAFSFHKESGTTASSYFVFLPSFSRDDNIELSEKNFEDQILREYITNTYDLDRNGYLSVRELSKINELKLSNLGDITSLKGIEYLSWLTSLNCSDLEKVTTLDISKNIHLKELNCSNTGITALNVGNNFNLKNLKIDNTKISAIDVSKNSKLMALYLDHTRITSLDVSQNPELMNLYFEKTPMVSLYVGKNSQLDSISSMFYANFITDSFNIKDFDQNIDLKKITMGNNGRIDYDTGIISGYDVNKPIEYEYDAGTSYEGHPVKLEVYIELAIEINETNFPDDVFRQYITDHFDTEDFYDILTVSEIGKIKKVDLTNYNHIKDITGIEHFTSLEELQCQNTEIKSLNLSKNTNLKKLVCDNTGITSLDLSNNHYLLELSCAGTPLAWLTLGQGYLQNYNLPQPQFNVQVNSSTFDITKVFEGIDPNSVTIVSGAKMKAGIVSEYKVGTPIVYVYRCGKAQSGLDVLLRVELNLTKSDRTLEFTEDLSVPKLYTGKVIDDPKMNIEGAIFTYEIWNDTVWEPLKNERPINVGTYRVTAFLPDDGYNNDATASSELTITKADNEFTTSLTIENWTYGEQAKKPVALAKYGTVKYTYSDSRTGVYTDQEPSDAGTYYVKATVEDTVNYKGLESIQEFTITKADNEFTTPLTIKNWTYGEYAKKPVALAKYGTVKYTYSDSRAGVYTDQAPRDAGTYYVKATVEGTKNYTGIESIGSFVIFPKGEEHHKEITISNINENEDIEKLVIKAGNQVLEKGIDYDIEIKQEGNVVTVIITFKGNYTGTIIKTYKVNIDEPDKEVNDQPEDDSKEEPNDSPKEEPNTKPIEVPVEKPKEQPKVEEGKDELKQKLKEESKTDIIKDTGNVTSTGFLSAWGMILAGCAYVFTGKKKDKKQ